jgi:acyl-CoA thioester hydrolase
MKIRVYYEDTDAGGIVYHSNYINFCERARSEAFFEKGMNPHLNIGSFVVRKLECDYLAPARLGDLLDVETKLIEVKNSSLVIEQNVYKEKVKLFSAKLILVFINPTGKPSRIPEDIKVLFKNLY